MIRIDPVFRGASAGNVVAIASLKLEGVMANAITVAAEIAHFFPDGAVTEALDVMTDEIRTRIKHVQSVVSEEQSSIIIDSQK